MAGARRLDPEGVRALLRRRWRGGRQRWLDGGGSWPLTILLHPPTERETTRDLAGVRDWIERWTAAHVEPDRPGELFWTERNWPALGRQRLPERLVLAGPEQVAAWVEELARWQCACRRADALRDLLAPGIGDEAVGRVSDSVTRHSATSDAPALGYALLTRPTAHMNPAPERGETLPIPEPRLARHFDWLTEAPTKDFDRLLAVLRWLIAHPDSGLYIRQLPIPGIDTKWIGANRGRLVDLLAQHQHTIADEEAAPGKDLHQLAGLRREPDLLRLRILDPDLRADVGGLGDISAPTDEIAALPLRPQRVFIVENLQTGLAFEPLPGAVCFMARGYAVDAFATIPWLRDCPCHYWGDLDTHGLAILDRLRRVLPHARSLLMDADTLLRHRDLWQREERPASGPLQHLTDAEQAVFQGLLNDRWGQHVRLEQERIHWCYASAQVRAAMAEA